MLKILLLLKLLIYITNPLPCIHEITEEKPKNINKEETKQIIEFVSSELQLSNSFKKLLLLVAKRESDYQSGIYHTKSEDLIASNKAWERLHNSTYYLNNTYSNNSDLWQTYGLFGMNSNYFVYLWSENANPKIMCDPINDVIFYKLKSEEIFDKLEKSECKTNWYNIHKGVNNGKVCRGDKLNKRFIERAKGRNLKHKRDVNRKELGVEISNPEIYSRIVRLKWKLLKLANGMKI